MVGRHAKVLSDQQIEQLIVYTSTIRNPERNRVIVLLSIKAGLRAGEIANLTWDMVLDPMGNVGTLIELRDHAAKKMGGRLIPLNADLRTALSSWRTPCEGVGAVLRSERGGHMTPVSIGIGSPRPTAQLVLIAARYSGRRTFITRAARVVHQAGASLRDDRPIQMTQRYIDGDTDAQRKLVALI